MRKPEQDEKFISDAYRLFEKFYRATNAYREKCRMNERYWRTNHWQNAPGREENEPQPVTPVMFSTLESMLADMMDSYPDAVILGEEPSDDSVADSMTQLVRYVLKRRHYRTIYRSKCRAALTKGTAVQEVFWDNSLYSGLGDVNVREWDIVNFCWDPEFENIQDGRAVFKIGFFPMEWYRANYPELAGEMRADEFQKFAAEPFVNNADDEVMLLEYWFKEQDAKIGGTRVHMVKLAGGVMLEDSRMEHPEGVYAHGQYPFIVEALYRLSGQPVGIGMVDVLKNLQTYADRLDQIILKNALMSGKMKMLVNRGADLDEDALTDMDAEMVRGARIDEGAVRWMQTAPLSNYVLSYQQAKLAAIKEESGQNQFSRGDTKSGVTAATAIIALQQAGSKRSRVLIDQFFDGFEALVRMMISVMTENYTEARIFRVRGEAGDRICRFGGAMDEIEFDVNVMVERQTPYSTLYQNELALQLMGAGVIGAEDALEMMGFEGKERVMRNIRHRAEEEKGVQKDGEQADGAGASGTL